MPYDKVIQEAGRLFQESDLGRLKDLTTAWNETQWQEVPHRQGLAACHEQDPAVINLFGDFAKAAHGEQLRAILAAFGESLFNRLGTPEAEKRWKKKLTLPEAAQIDQVQERLANEQYPTYRAIMESLATLMDRYVSINLTNALTENGVTRRKAINLDLRQYGCTLAYANIRALHSLVPYLSAYGCPRSVYDSAGHALAEKLVDTMGHITESSLSQAFERLITEVFTLCRA
jgi:hypothetical protein